MEDLDIDEVRWQQLERRLTSPKRLVPIKRHQIPCCLTKDVTDKCAVCIRRFGTLLFESGTKQGHQRVIRTTIGPQVPHLNFSFRALEGDSCLFFEAFFQRLEQIFLDQDQQATPFVMVDTDVASINEFIALEQVSHSQIALELIKRKTQFQSYHLDGHIVYIVDRVDPSFFPDSFLL